MSTQYQLVKQNSSGKVSEMWRCLAVEFSDASFVLGTTAKMRFIIVFDINVFIFTLLVILAC